MFEYNRLMFEYNILKSNLKALKHLRLKRKWHLPITCGICGNVPYPHYLDFSTWPHYSGNPVYPIPSSWPDTPETMFKRTPHKLKWYKSDYSKMRIDLLNHLIKQTEHEIKTLTIILKS